MAEKIEAKWQTLRNFLGSYLKENTNYRAGTIYEDYLNEDNAENITRKDFEMFLRDQVIKDNGLLKRVSHGVYTMRTSPEDKGVSFGRENNKVKEITLDEILDDSVDLSNKIKIMFDKLKSLDGIPFPAQMELNRLKALLGNSVDTAITCITATMAWCEDNIDIQDNNQTIKMV